MPTRSLPAEPRIRLTDHFTLDEFDQGQPGDPHFLRYPDAWIAERLRPLCVALEAIRTACGDRAITVLSGYRDEAHNRAVGGSRFSQHIEGRAADFTVEGMEPAIVHAVVLGLYQAGRLRIGGLGLYAGWVHVDVRQGVRLARWTG